MGDAQSAQRDGKSETAAEEQSAVEDGPSGESTHDKLMQNNGQISELNGKPDGTIADDRIAKEAVTVKDKEISVTKTSLEEVANVQIIQEELPDPNEEEPIEIINMDAKQNDLNESFRRFFSNIGLKLTVKKGSGDQADDEAEKEGREKLDVVEETASETKYEDVEQITDANTMQDNDSTTCPTLTEGTSDGAAETVEEKIAEAEEIADNVEGQETNVTVDEQDSNQKHNATLDQSPTKQEEEEFASPIKKFFTTGIFAGLKKKKIEEESEDKELVDMSKNDADEAVDQQDIVEASANVEEQETDCKEVQESALQTSEPPEVEDRGKSPSTDQDSESEITSSQEKIQSSPLKRLFSGTTFKRRSKRQKGRRSSDSKLSDSGEQVGNQIVASSEKTEQQEIVVETPASSSPLPTEPEEELSAWEAFKKLMTPKKSLKKAFEEVQVQAVAPEETKSSEGERLSDHSTEEGRKRKDSAHSWEAVLCGSGRRRSRKTSDSEDEQKQDGDGESPNEAADVVTSTPKQASSPSDSESSTWKSFKKLMTPKRKLKDDEENKENVQSDSETTQEESLFSIKKLLPGRKKGRSGDKQDQLSSDEGDKEVISIEEDSETPAVVPLSEFDKSEAEETVKTDVDIQNSELESEQEHILEIPKTFVQEVQEHKVTPIIPLNQDQDELTEFSKYQQLSDIPEEGNITETAASLLEDVIKDDTIAEDMVELTSEAITAPDPVDITMADETDELMLSAASHLTESSKTSGNATPVPAEYDDKDTDVLLKEVAETISTGKKADTCSEELALEKVAGSVKFQTFERSTDVIEEHAQSDAVTFETGLQVEHLEDTDVEIPDTVLSESLSEFKDAISTEYVSEVSKVEFKSAIDVDEVHTAQKKRLVKQESVDDSDYMIESISEVPETIDVVLQDDNVVQSALPVECQEGELAKQSEQLIALEAELPKGEVGSVRKMENEEAIQKHGALVESAEIKDNIELDQSVIEEIVDVHSLKETLDLDKEESKELSKKQVPEECDEATETKGEVENEEEQKVLMKSVKITESVHPDQSKVEETVDRPSLESIPEDTPDLVKVSQEFSTVNILEDLHKVTETSVEAEIVAEEDFEIVHMKDVEDKEPLERQNLSEDVIVPEKRSVLVTDLATKEDIIKLIATEEPEKVIIDEDGHGLVEEQSSYINAEARKEEVPVTDEESKEKTNDVVPEVVFSQDEDATKTSQVETFEEEEIMTQSIEKVNTAAAQQNDNVELEDKPLPEVVADETDEKIETTETQEEEIKAEEGINTLNGLVIVSSTEEYESEAVSQFDHALYLNCDHSEAKPSEGKIMQVHHSHEVAEDIETLTAEHVSSINENSGVVQILEDTINIEKNSEIFLTTTEEAIHEVLIGQMEVRIEEQLEEEIPHPVTEVAEVEFVALLEENTATLQQTTATMPDLVIQKSAKDREKISEKNSIACVDNAEVCDEPKHDVQITEIEQVGIQGEKDGQIVLPETTNVDVQHTLVAELTTCSFKDVVSQLPDISIKTQQQYMNQYSA
ncbi:hypothetical protein WMY93_017211 [Mugilogobius chulae]|uniref:A kinase-anchoring proteins AKAP-5 and AKAP-12 calmodulin (CaM)-binding domain-containing protein n=1 Tax=Mugilogobius chulae TaxID=88201 RepID=A0AAW0NRX4_9GOBI